MSNKRLVILGAGGHACVIAGHASTSGWKNIVFYDDNADVGPLYDWQVMGTIDKYFSIPQPNDRLIVGIGKGSVRQKLMQRAVNNNIELANVIHPKSTISPWCKIGKGVLICADACINIGATIGDGVILNTGAIVGHDCTIGNYAHMGPNSCTCGHSTVGDRSWVGVGTAVKECVGIGSDVMIGAGSTVIGNVPDGVTAYGVVK